jgi:hypothetical protein
MGQAMVPADKERVTYDRTCVSRNRWWEIREGSWRLGSYKLDYGNQVRVMAVFLGFRGY